MGRDRLVAGVGLANEKVGLVADVDQRIGPFGVAGKSDHLAFGLEAEPETRSGAIIMHDVEGCYPQAADLAALADLQFLKQQSESQIEILVPGKPASMMPPKRDLRLGGPAMVRGWSRLRT